MARTAPAQGRPDNRPIINQIGDVPLIDGGQLDLKDRAAMYDTVRHKFGCPMEDSPFASETEDDLLELDGGGTRTITRTLRAGRDQRMEHHLATPPRTDQNPVPAPILVVACLECGARSNITNIE